MILLDSSVIIAAFRPKEKHCLEARKIIEKKENFIILDSVFSECMTVLKMREGHKIANDCADLIEKNNDFLLMNLKKEYLQKAILFFRQNNNPLSFVDTILVVLSISLKIPVITFDKDLQKALS